MNRSCISKVYTMAMPQKSAILLDQRCRGAGFG